jgi:hypothetical protein
MLNKTMKHENCKSQKVQSSQSFGKALIVTSKTTKTGYPAETAFNDSTARQKDKPLLRLWKLDDNQVNTMLLIRLNREVTRIALVNKSHLDMVASNLLNLLRQLLDLSAVLLISGSHVQGQQIAEGIDCQMRLAAFASLRPVVSCSLTAFRTGLQGSTVKDGNTGLVVSTLFQAQQQPQVMHHRLKYACFQPALQCCYRFPRWQVIGHHSPRCPLRTM